MMDYDGLYCLALNDVKSPTSIIFLIAIIFMNNNYNNKSILISIYNSAYKSYLNGTNPPVLLHTALLNILRFVGRDGCGIILNYDSKTLGFKVITYAFNKD